MYGTQTERSQRDGWPTDGPEADAAQLSPAPWKKMAGLTQAYSCFVVFRLFALRPGFLKERSRLLP